MRKVIPIVIGVIILAIIGVGGYFLYKNISSKKGTLTVWTISGNESALKKVADIYHAKYPDYTVKIVPLPEQVYEFRSLYSLATQKGTSASAPPDIWVVPNEWLTLHKSKLVAAPDGSLDAGVHGYSPSPAPAATPAPEVAKGRSNVEIITQDYGKAAQQNLIQDDKVWGVPLNSDSLALFYDTSKISTPPKTWNEVVDLTKRFTQRSENTVNRSTIALGDTETVAHGLDILSVLMLQNGAEMVDQKDNIATFNVSPTGGTAAGTFALDYYTSFTRPEKETYTWNKTFGPSLKALADGKTMMAIGYLSDLDQFGPLGQTRIGVANLPQVNTDKPQTYGRYLAATVTKQAADPEAAWNFVNLFTNPSIAEDYATTLRVVPGRVDVAKRLALGPQYKPFQDQAAHAVTWPKKEVAIADGALNEAVTLVLKNGDKPQTALDVAAKAYSAFLQTESGLTTDSKILTLWQPENDSVSYGLPVRNFLAENKDITRVQTTRKSQSRFEWELLNATAAHLGPDIALVPNDHVARYAPLLRAFPESAFNPTNKRIGDREVLEKVYAPALLDDNLIDDRLYGIPAHVETLMLAYNRDSFRELEKEKNEAADEAYIALSDMFASGPTLWDDLVTMTEASVAYEGDTITRPFIALGTGANVVHAEDIFAVITKQYGGEMTDPDRQRTGIHLPISSEEPAIPGQEALDFIRGFANIDSNHYTWNKDFPNSLEALADGKVMMAFVYPRDVTTILKRNPQINLKYFPLPQADIPSSPIDFASYYSLTIPKASSHSKEAFAFVQTAVLQQGGEGFVSPDKDANSPDSINRPGEPNIQQFQKNTAESYFKGLYPDDVDQSIIDLIDNKITLDQAANRINQALKRPILSP